MLAFLKDTAAMTDHTTQHPKLIKLKTVAEQTGMGASTVLAWERDGRFAKAVRLSPTLRLWLQEDIDNWIRERHAQSISANESQNP